MYSPGTRVGAYEIVDLLGAGRMGEVYRAVDSRLGRHVALKFLHGESRASGDRLRRLQDEARALARLSHPNIITIYAVEVDRDVPFLAMELVEGRSLDRLIIPGGLPLDRFLEIAVPVTDAIGAAHAAGLIHRDLKPAHVMVSNAGRVKLLDLGLAKLTSRAPAGAWRDVDPDTELAEVTTVTGRLSGTPGYMSPEQLLGGVVDFRSDLYSLGVIFYEMLTGRRPGDARTLGELVAQLQEGETEPVCRVRASIPTGLGDIVDACLESEPWRRPESAAVVQNTLVRLARRAPPSVRSIAVLPFADMTAGQDQRHLCEGLAEEIIHGLSALPCVRVLARSSSFGYGAGRRDVREIGRRLGADAVLEGGLRREGDSVRITTRLISTEDGREVWSGKFEGAFTKLFEMEDTITREVVRALAEVVDRDVPASRRPADIDAYDSYLRGRAYLYRDVSRDIGLAMEMFRTAIDRDPEFARAWCGLADAFSYLYMHAGGQDAGLVDESLAAAHRALELEPELAEAHASLGLALSLKKDYARADASFRRAIQLDPTSFEAHYFFARSRFAQGEFVSAGRLFLEGARLRLDDYQSLALAAQVFRDVGEAERAGSSAREAVARIERQLALHPDDARALYLGARCLLQLQEPETALAWNQRALDMAPNDPATLYGAACNLALAGQHRAAIACLESALAAGFAHADWIEQDGDLNSLRELPAFTKLMERLRRRSRQPA